MIYFVRVAVYSGVGPEETATADEVVTALASRITDLYPDALAPVSVYSSPVTLNANGSRSVRAVVDLWFRVRLDRVVGVVDGIVYRLSEFLPVLVTSVEMRDPPPWSTP
jgi:hypothetical protein